MSQPLSIETITAGSDCAIIRVGGEIDVYTAPTLREALLELISRGISNVIADLGEVTFLDSTGLGAIVGGHKRLRAAGEGTLALACCPERIVRLFRITGLDRAFILHDSVPLAIADQEAWKAAISSEDTDPDEWCRRHGLL